MYSFLYTPM